MPTPYTGVEPGSSVNFFVTLGVRFHAHVRFLAVPVTTNQTPKTKSLDLILALGLSAMPNVASLASATHSEIDGILRLAPCWVPRSFLQPGRRLRLHPNDYRAFGMHRGGIDELWLGSTIEAANENREEDEGLSYCVHNGQKFLFRDAIEELQGEVIAMPFMTSTASGRCSKSCSTTRAPSRTTRS